MNRYLDALQADYPELLAAIAATEGALRLGTVAEPDELGRAERALQALVEDTRDQLVAAAEETGEAPRGEAWVYAACVHALLLGCWLGQQRLTRFPEAPVAREGDSGR